MIWLKNFILLLTFLIASTSQAKNICVAMDFYDANWTEAFFKTLSGLDAQYAPSSRPSRNELEIIRGSKALGACLSRPHKKVVYISHALKISGVAFLVSLDKSAQPSNTSKQSLTDLKIHPSVKEITILSCYYRDLLQMYDGFDFWRSRGITVDGIETPSLLDEEGRGYVSVYQAASKVAESVWTERYRKPAPFTGLEPIR